MHMVNIYQKLIILVTKKILMALDFKNKRSVIFEDLIDYITQGELSTELSKIRVGARNYIKNSDKLYNINNEIRYIPFTFDSTFFKEGDNIILSFYVYGNSEDAQFDLYFRSNSQAISDFYETTPAIQNEWRRDSIKIELTSEIINETINIAIRTSGASKNQGNISLSYIQLEKSNLTSDWSLNTYDTDALRYIDINSTGRVVTNKYNENLTDYDRNNSLFFSTSPLRNSDITQNIGNASIHLGNKNSTIGNFSYSVGNNNIKDNSASFGIDNESNKVYSFLIGRDLKSNKISYKSTLGQYNEDLENVTLEVGVGTNNNNRRSIAFSNNKELLLPSYNSLEGDPYYSLYFDGGNTLKIRNFGNSKSSEKILLTDADGLSKPIKLPDHYVIDDLKNTGEYFINKLDDTPDGNPSDYDWGIRLFGNVSNNEDDKAGEALMIAWESSNDETKLFYRSADGTNEEGDAKWTNWNKIISEENVLNLIDQNTAFEKIDVPEISYENVAYSIRSFNNKSRGITYREGSLDLGYSVDRIHQMGYYSLKAGVNSEASGSYSVALGNNTIASAQYSLATGNRTKATGAYSSSFGLNTSASGLASFSAGNNTIASGDNSVALGDHTIASGINSVALGYNCEAKARHSLASGNNIIVNYQYQVAVGSYNDSKSNNYFEVGIGSGASRKNGFEITNIGEAYCPEITNSSIDSAGDKILVTKEWVLEQLSNL